MSELPLGLYLIGISKETFVKKNSPNFKLHDAVFVLLKFRRRIYLNRWNIFLTKTKGIENREQAFWQESSFKSRQRGLYEREGTRNRNTTFWQATPYGKTPFHYTLRPIKLAHDMILM